MRFQGRSYPADHTLPPSNEWFFPKLWVFRDDHTLQTTLCLIGKRMITLLWILWMTPCRRPQFLNYEFLWMTPSRPHFACIITVTLNAYFFNYEFFYGLHPADHTSITMRFYGLHPADHPFASIIKLMLTSPTMNFYILTPCRPHFPNYEFYGWHPADHPLPVKSN